MDTVRYFKERAKAQLKDLRATGDTTVGLQRVQHLVAVGAGYGSWGDLIDAEEINRQLAAVMDREPALCLNGFGAGSYANTMQQRHEQFTRSRIGLRDSWRHVDQIREWLLQNIAPRKTLNDDAYSYGLKHMAERVLGGYVSNGELIAAAITAGYPYRRSSAASPNALFGMSSRSITALRRQTRG